MDEQSYPIVLHVDLADPLMPRGSQNKDVVLPV